MKLQKFFDEVVAILKKDKRFISESGDLMRNAVYEAAMKMDERLLKLLYANAATKKAFFKKVGSITIFDKQEFGWTVSNEEFLPDSYTRFRNKIGLANENGEYLSSSRDVELVFPYKDCILEGGQTKEDEGRDEIFYNRLLARDEVNRLLDPKVLVGARKYERNKICLAKSFADENLVIKGNNLLALASLLSRYREMIQLIYIDPPYNTKNDEFGYNDSFNHSTWLVFMKNRLELAKKLLKREGCIFIQCDDNEQAYLKVLCDEVFGPENFVNCIAVKMSEATGVKMSHARSRFPKLKEYLLFYKREGFEGFAEIDKYKVDEWDAENNIFLENFTREDRIELERIGEKDNIDDGDISRIMAILKPVKKVSLNGKIKKLGIPDGELSAWLLENSYRIIKTCGSASLQKLVSSRGVKVKQDLACALSSDGVLFFYITDYNPNTPQPRLRVIFADENIYKNPCDFWQDIKTTGAISNEGGVQLLNGKKPEALLKRIIKMTTKKGEIVLDFFGGSGTAGAVAHKLGRRYILCEQLDDHVEKEVRRLADVIAGEQTGISKEVNWKGGGSFVYCELAKSNQVFVARIEKAKKDAELVRQDKLG